MEACDKCGAMIEYGREELHKWHHEKLDAVYESVEAILMVLPTKEPNHDAS